VREETIEQDDIREKVYSHERWLDDIEKQLSEVEGHIGALADDRGIVEFKHQAAHYVVVKKK
jgi:hypothetical protein